MIEVRLRPLAEVDLVERVRYYRSEGGDELGGRPTLLDLSVLLTYCWSANKASRSSASLPIVRLDCKEESV